MFKITLFISIIALFIYLRFMMNAKIQKDCGTLLYRIPIRVFYWHILCISICFILFILVFYAEMTVGINEYLPDALFVLFNGMVAGICAFAIIQYFTTPIGIYDNGVLTHFTFIKFEDLEAFKIENKNSLNIGKNTTAVFKIKEETINHPSFELSAKAESKVIELLTQKGIKQTMFEQQV